MDAGELATRWTVRLSLTLYVLSLALRVRGSTAKQSWARMLWTAGCGLFLLHVVCAFHFFHHWSHSEAEAATARRTLELTGLDWGGGLYLNYAFTALWLTDVVWWRVRPAGYLSRPRVIEWAVQGFMAFIAFNATVVFEEGMLRWLALAACLGLGISWLSRKPSKGWMHDS